MSTTPATEGERRRDAALAQVAAHRAAQICAAQRRMLSIMRARADRTGTSDDCTAPGAQYDGNAPWLGAAVRQLAERKIIFRVGTVRSLRPSRKANEVKLWKLADDSRADAAIAHLRRTLAAVVPSPEIKTLF